MPTLSIVGAHFRPPAKAVLQVLPSGAPLRVRREPENPVDVNAVAVDIHNEDIPADSHDTLATLVAGNGMSLEEALEPTYIHLGYIPASEAVLLTNQLPATTPGTLVFSGKGKPMVAFTLPGEN